MSETIPRRWFRFSIRALLALILVVSLPLMWIAKERRQSVREHEIARQLTEQGTTVMFGGPFDDWDDLVNSRPQSPWRITARDVLGDRIVWIEVSKPEVNDLTLFSGLEYLRVLTFPKFSQVSDIRPLADSHRLRHLNLRYSQVADLTPLTELTELRMLDLDGTRVQDVSPLARSTKLQVLGLESTKVSDMSPLNHLSKLSQLDLTGAEIADVAALSQLTNLHMLRLGLTRVRDIAPLSSLKKLESLTLYRCEVTDAAVAELQNALPNCKIEYDH